MAVSQITTIIKHDHHDQHELCRTRPPYRQGRRLTSVKVYTVNDESQHLMISGVPKLQLFRELTKILIPYGSIKKIVRATEYPVEEFTEAFHIHYERIQSARIAKRSLDGKNFFGGIFHVFYAPELETISETRRKLIQRRRDIGMRIMKNANDARSTSNDVFKSRTQLHRRKRHPALPQTSDRLNQQYPREKFISVCDRVSDSIDLRLGLDSSSLLGLNEECGSNLHLHGLDISRDVSANRKHYLVRSIDNHSKFHVVRPYSANPEKPVTFNTQTESNIISTVRRIDNSTKMKVPPIPSKKQKRIIMRDPSTTRLIRPSKILQSSIEVAKSSIRKAMKKNERAVQIL